MREYLINICQLLSIAIDIYSSYRLNFSIFFLMLSKLIMFTRVESGEVQYIYLMIYFLQ